MVATVKGRVISELMQETMKYLAELEKENAELREENEILKGDTMSPILSIKFIAEYTGVSIGTVGEWLITGELKGSKKGGRWIVKREDFMAWLNDEPPTKLKLAKAR